MREGMREGGMGRGRDRGEGVEWSDIGKGLREGG